MGGATNRYSPYTSAGAGGLTVLRKSSFHFFIPGVVHVVGFGKTPVPIDESEITAIQAAVKSGLPSLPWPFLEIGHRVRIEHGPLCGLQGILLGFRGHQRLVLSVTLLQRSVAVQIDEAWVQPIAGQKGICGGQVPSESLSWQPIV